MFTWPYFLITFLIVYHLANNIFSIYVHRSVGHNHFVINYYLEHFFRFWLWFTLAFGSYYRWKEQYAGQHRKHHRYPDTPLDPHSPHHYTIRQLLDYSHNDPTRANFVTDDEIKLYAPGVMPVDDWMQQHIYSQYPKGGILLNWILQTILFGATGFIAGACIYFFIKDYTILAGNYSLHVIGFRPKGTKDKSVNLSPIGVIMGGESLHANHHNDVSKPYFHRNWWEIDTGWIYCRLFILLGLMQLK